MVSVMLVGGTKVVPCSQEKTARFPAARLMVDVIVVAAPLADTFVEVDTNAIAAYAVEETMVLRASAITSGTMRRYFFISWFGNRS
jgi:hypothetical protein